MNKIPPLKKILPESPDQILKFSSESSSGLARMAHVNRAAQYFGMDAEFLELDFSQGSSILISKPSGFIKVLNANIPLNDYVFVDVIWDNAVFLAQKGVKTPCYVQLTPVGTKTTSVNVQQFVSDMTDAIFTVGLYSVPGTTDAGFFYSIVPQ